MHNSTQRTFLLLGCQLLVGCRNEKLKELRPQAQTSAPRPASAPQQNVPTPSNVSPQFQPASNPPAMESEGIAVNAYFNFLGQCEEQSAAILNRFSNAPRNAQPTFAQFDSEEKERLAIRQKLIENYQPIMGEWQTLLQNINQQPCPDSCQRLKFLYVQHVEGLAQFCQMTIAIVQNNTQLSPEESERMKQQLRETMQPMKLNAANADAELLALCNRFGIAKTLTIK